MKQIDAMYAWDPETDRIKIGPWPDTARWSDAFEMTGGACEAEIHILSEPARVARLFVDFHTCVVRDGVDVQAAHRAFLVIDEYRWAIAPDTPGAERD